MIPNLVAYADALVEPKNDFYTQHSNQIIYLGRSFYAVGEDGTVSIKKAPYSNDNVAFAASAETIYIDYSCLYKGKFWGFTQRYSGWVKLDELLVLYDYVAFAEKHFEEFYFYEGDYAEIKKYASAIAWPWPGADAPLWTFEDLDTANFRASCAYNDEQGREWGFITYLYGSRNIWVCLSDPLNRDIPVLNPAPEPGVWLSETVHTDIGKSVDSTLAIIIVLVALLVSGTAVLIRMVWMPEKTKPGGNSDE